MWRILITVAVVAAALPGSIAEADDDENTLSASVSSTATIVTHVVTNTSTNVFEVENCAEGQPITNTWDAAQPDKGDTSQAEAFYFSGPDQTQRLLLTTVGAFSPGYGWVGSGTVACGLTEIPVSGSGSTNIVS